METMHPLDIDTGSAHARRTYWTTSDMNASTDRVKNMPTKIKKSLGRYIVADPAICHGKPTFRGTRIMVRQVLKQVAKDTPWDKIVETWGGSVSKEAIAEAVALAERIFVDHAIEYGEESVTT